MSCYASLFLWHESNKNLIKTDRIYLEIHIQNIDEPTTKYKILGKKNSKLKPLFNKNKIFSNSRVSRIISFKKKIRLLEKKIIKIMINNICFDLQ